MTDDTKALPITDRFNVPTVFVNQVVGAGHFNGVLNLTLACAQFSPNAAGGVDPDLVISARLRMDLFCAESLYAQLGIVIQQMTKANGTTAQ